MKYVFLLLSNFAVASSAANLVGSWKYMAYEYRGVIQSLPDLNLNVRLTFNEKGISKLNWDHNGQEFCERDAKFEVRSSSSIYQKIIWVNPNNHISCAEDADMQLDNESVTPYKIENDSLKLYLDLSGEPFIYIMRKISL